MKPDSKTILQWKSLIQRYNYKRYRRLRHNLLINFIIMVLLIFIQKDLLKSINWLYVTAVVVYGLVSFPLQVVKYNTQLPTKDYKIKLNKENVSIYRIQIYASLLLLVYSNLMLMTKFNLMFVIIYNITYVLLILWNLYIYMWVIKVLIPSKDKYSIVVKNIYFKIPKKDRKF